MSSEGLNISASKICKVKLPQQLTDAFEIATPIAFDKFYLIGSSVRKCLLKEPGWLEDIDFIGAFDIKQVQHHFGRQVIGRWEQFGTIKVLSDGLEIDFISDVDIKRALKRRDITMSLLCIDGNGTVYDPCNYYDDLRKRVIRIEDAEQKIQVEPERILRVLRFAATLGYNVDPSTRIACTNNAHLMSVGNCEYALNKFVRMDPTYLEKAMVLAEEFGIFGFVNNLVSQKGK